MNQPHYSQELDYWDRRGKEAYVSLSRYDQQRISGWIEKGPAERDCLDVGGGSGMTAALLAVDQHAFVTCLDISLEMVRHSPVASVQGDALRMPYADASFDLIVAAAFFHHLPGREEEVLRECARVLRPGGRIVGYDPSAQCLQNKVFMGSGPFRLKFFSPDERPIDIDNFSKMLHGSGFSVGAVRLFSFRNARWTAFETVQRLVLNPLSVGPARRLFQRWFFWSATLQRPGA